MTSPLMSIENCDTDDCPSCRCSTVALARFNALRPSVLTSQLLDAGFTPGRVYPAVKFAKRLEEAASGQGRPLLVAVFGNSFTIGSNCGESSSQDSEYECAWPFRLSKRMEEIFFGRSMNGTTFGASVFGKDGKAANHNTKMIEWRMYQTNAQSSANVAQKLPSVVHEFNSKNVTPDAIILNNLITDLYFSKPWFEAVVRAFLRSYPETVIVSLVDAQSQVVKDQRFNSPLHKLLYGVQRHYGLPVMDFANMVRLLHNNESSYTSQLSNNPIILQHLNESHNSNSSVGKLTEPLDLLWPQSGNMITSNGTIVGDLESAKVNPVYWLNYLPRVQKTKGAYYPNNHPPWPTHQYVADAITYLFLRVTHQGLGCESDLDRSTSSPPASSHLPMNITEETVAKKAELDSCFICLPPSTRIDARSTRYIANFTSTNITNNSTSLHRKHPVIVTCGDWKWITDDRNRAGWQSDQHGSMIRFRLNVSSDEPTLSMMYMGSYEMFGNLRVTFRAVTKEEDEAPPLGCGDIDNNPYDRESSDPMPSLELRGHIRKHSLWQAAVFPKQVDRYDLNARGFWNLFNQTVLGRKDMEYVDMYVENPNHSGGRSRIKIQTVTSC